MEKRINVIVNGRQSLPNVVANLKQLFESGDRILILTKSCEEEVRRTMAESLGWNEEKIGGTVMFIQFNKNGYGGVDVGGHKVVCIKMPNSLYHSIPTALNDALRFVDATGIARFVHFFADDCRIISYSYSPDAYEAFMDRFNEPFVMDSKTNNANYAFKKYSPRFIFMSQEHLRYPVSFVQFEAKEHFIIDRERLKENFDEKVNRLYMTEFIFRLHNKGVVKHTTFYPDPVLEQWVERDERLPHTADVEKMQSEYAADSTYLKETVKLSLAVENTVDPIIKEMVDVIENVNCNSGK